MEGARSLSDCGHPGPRGLCQEIVRGDLALTFKESLQYLWAWSAPLAQASHFEPHYLDVEFILGTNFTFQALERGAREFFNLLHTGSRPSADGLSAS